MIMKLALVLLSVCIGYSSAMLGGPSAISKQDEQSPNFIMALREAVKFYNMRSNSMYHHAMFNYESIDKQTVAGIAYRFAIVLAETGCRNNDVNSVKSIRQCPMANADAAAVKCTFKVLWRSWSEPNYMVLNDKMDCVPVTHLTKSSIQHRTILGHDDHDIGHVGQFEEFKKMHNKIYASKEEESHRFGVFRENMKKAYAYQILDHGSARYGATQFADLTEEEFAKVYLTPTWDTSKKPTRLSEVEMRDIPTSFDWREKGAVTEVKNQGSCGSCWAFSTTGNIEGQWFLAKNKLVDVSEQELVDCDKVDEGCNGGLPSQAYKEIIRLGGLETESAYPYKGRDMKCSFNRTKVAVYINDSVAISQDEAQMAAWLVQNGPISIGINANTMQFYMGGIAHPWKIFCNPKDLDHGVLIAGYGVKGTEPYWIIKNSWGPSWGEKGYYLVYRGDGTCGLNTMCTSAVVK